MTKIEGSESCDKNPATLNVELSIENKFAGSQSKNSYKKVKTIEEKHGWFFFLAFTEVFSLF